MLLRISKILRLIDDCRVFLWLEDDPACSDDVDEDELAHDVVFAFAPGNISEAFSESGIGSSKTGDAELLSDCELSELGLLHG